MSENHICMQMHPPNTLGANIIIQYRNKMCSKRTTHTIVVLPHVPPSLFRLCTCLMMGVNRDRHRGMWDHPSQRHPVLLDMRTDQLGVVLEGVEM